MAQSVTTRDDGDVIDHSGLVMTTMQDRLFSVILNQLPTPRPEQYTKVHWLLISHFTCFH